MPRDRQPPTDPVPLAREGLDTHSRCEPGVVASNDTRAEPDPARKMLYHLLPQSPSKDLDFEFPSVRWPVRDFQL